MTWLRSLVLAISLAIGLGSASASASARWVDYSPANFARAQETGQTMLVDVTAKWCTTCKAQHPILEELTGDERLKDVMFVRVDFDTHKDFLQEHQIPRQSTILVFDGKAEIDRSVAETNRDRLRQFVFAAVEK